MSDDDQAQAVRDLMRRNVGSRASQFTVTVSSDIGVMGKDTFRVCVIFSILCCIYIFIFIFPSVLWHCSLGYRKDIRPVIRLPSAFLLKETYGGSILT